MTENDCYYFITVYSFGVSRLLRGLTLKEAEAMYEQGRTAEGITYMQFGVSGAPQPLGSLTK